MLQNGLGFLRKILRSAPMNIIAPIIRKKVGPEALVIIMAPVKFPNI